jgi:phytoene/squalene synthetase
MSADRKNELDFSLDLDFEAILTNPILDIAARFWENERYEAFRVCYRSMRVVDNLVDDRKATGQRLSKSEKTQFRRMIFGWLEALEQGERQGGVQTELLDTIKRFQIPIWPWQKLAEAMVFDLEYDGFKTFLQFRRYAEGAAVAPASVFVHLCGVTGSGHGYAKPSFDIRGYARWLAVFSYLVHIMRDFCKDTRAGLNYFANNLLAKHELDLRDLIRCAESGQPDDRLRSMMRQYRAFAEYYRARARQSVDEISPLLDPRYRLSMEIIYELYLQILQRVTPDREDFRLDDIQPTAGEVQDLINQTVTLFRQSG